MGSMAPLSRAGVFILVSVWMAVALTRAAAAQKVEFDVAQHGHPVGTASCQFTKNADGIESKSLVRVAMEGLDYALSKDEQLSADRQIKHVQLNAAVNGEAVHVVVEPDSAQLLMNTSAAGKSTTTRLDAHAGAVVLADFDPGALETLLAVGAAQNGRDLWAVIPKQNGSIDPVQLATYADQEGTLDGKPIAVHHLIATIAGANTDLFAGPENQLLQAELPQEGFALVRKGFVLTPPTRPIAPSTE